MSRRDILLYGLSQSDWVAGMIEWAKKTPGIHQFVPDAHRLQLEYWIWLNREKLGRSILDVGVYNRRSWLGDGYLTFGEHGEDVVGDLLALPFPDAAFDGVVLTEVLEHCVDPRMALHEVSRVMKPGGVLLVTSPFIWPTHGIEGEYKDYWRFTRQGWELLLEAFTDVVVTSCEWTDEGAAAYDAMRRFECMGYLGQTEATTGYLCEARKR